MSWGMIAMAGATLVTGYMSYKANKDSGAKEANEAAADATGTQNYIALDQYDRYKQLYEPLENQFVNSAQNYASPENYAKAAGQAAATVSSQFAKERDELARTPGLDPSSAAYQAGMTNLGLQEAAASATAQNTARQTVSDTAYQRQLAALGLGKNLDSTASSGLSNVASQNLSLANSLQNQANGESKAIGDTFGTLGSLAYKTLGSSGGNSGAGSANAANGLTFGDSAANSLYQF